MRSGLAIEMRIWSKLCGPADLPEDVHQLIHRGPLSGGVVMPAKAGIQGDRHAAWPALDPRFRGGDGQDGNDAR